MPIDACTKTSTAFDLLIDADQEVLRKGSASQSKDASAFDKRLTTPLIINKKKDHPIAQRNNAQRYALPHNVFGASPLLIDAEVLRSNLEGRSGVAEQVGFYVLPNVAR